MAGATAALVAGLALALLVACAPPPAAPPGSGPTTTPLPTPSPPPAISTSDQAIAAAKQRFAELQGIDKAPPGAIGATSDIKVLDRPDGWNLVFWRGSGDCPAGCINHHYWYVTVTQSASVAMSGEYVREFNSAANAFETRGQPMWGIPER